MTYCAFFYVLIFGFFVIGQFCDDDPTMIRPIPDTGGKDNQFILFLNNGAFCKLILGFWNRNDLIHKFRNRSRIFYIQNLRNIAVIKYHKHNVSRAKLAYLIDATAAPVCIIAPISSWAAAVTGFVEGEDGFSIFIRAIPYNYYAILTVVMMVTIVILNIDYGPMKLHEKNALNGDLYTTPDRPYANAEEDVDESKGTVIDLVVPIVVLIISCVIGMIYTGGFFEGAGFVEAFSNSDASVGLINRPSPYPMRLFPLHPLSKRTSKGTN